MMFRRIVALGLLLLVTTGAGVAAPADPADLLKAGTDALHQGQWDDAIRALTQAIAARGLSGSERAVAYNQRGYAYFAKGQTDRAIPDYSEAIRLAPKNADAHNLRGWAHFSKGSMNQAVTDSTAAIRIDPNLVFAYRNRGRALLYLGRAKAAADDFATAVRLAPADALGVIWLHVARVRSSQNDAEEFKTNTAAVDRGEWPGPLLDVVTGAATPERVADLAKSAPDDKQQRERVCDARVYLGLLQLGAGEKDEARKLLSAAVADCPPGAAGATELKVANLELKAVGGAPAGAGRGAPGAALAPTHEERGRTYFNEGHVDRAIAEFSSAIRSAPNEPRNYHLRGLAYFTKGAMDRAIADTTAALRLDPNSALSLRVRGLAQLYSGRPRPAADDFAAAVRLLPSDALGVIWLHVARGRAGHEDAQELRANLAKVDRREWTGVLVEALNGEKTSEQVNDAAGSAGDEPTRRERLCDARVYVGLLRLAAGDKDEARKLLNAAAADCPSGAAEAAEVAVARMELKRLGAEPVSGAARARSSKPAPAAQDSEQQAEPSR